jgi:hypothetical protein
MRTCKTNVFLFTVCLILITKYCTVASNITNEIVKETLLQSKQSQVVRIAWWVPEEFWLESFKANPAMSKEQIDQFISFFHSYTLLIVVDGKIGIMGGVNYSDEQDIRKSLVLTSGSGVKYRPIDDSLLSADLKNFLIVMKPLMSNAIGALGQNMNFYVFQGNGPEDTPIIDAKSKGSFTVTLQNEEFRWRLPIAALLPRRTCPNCKETFPGTYNYCPYDGNKTKTSEKPHKNSDEKSD